MSQKNPVRSRVQLYLASILPFALNLVEIFKNKQTINVKYVLSKGNLQIPFAYLSGRYLDSSLVLILGQLSSLGHLLLH